MIYLIDGKATDQLSAANRGLQYGDGLFETLLLTQGRLTFWSRHMARLFDGCQRLAITPPDPELLLDEAQQLCAQRRSGVLKIIITRGSGGRGYQSPLSAPACRILAFHPKPTYPAHFAQQGVAVRICQTRLGSNPALAGLKHLNRLEQVMARQEWRGKEITEGIMLDGQGNAIEGVMSNLFLVHDDQLWTPDLSNCGVAGIMREAVIEVAEELNIPVNIGVIPEAELYRAKAMFLTNAVIGLWPVKRLAGRCLELSPLGQRINTEVETKKMAEALVIP